jgi:hypothetical protein
MILLDPNSVPEGEPIALDLHVVATLTITAEEARRRVNRQVVPDLGTGLVAGEPELMIGGEEIAWRVPLLLSLPNLGELGQVGTVAVEARSGELSLTPEMQQRIISHARRLYAGATLQAE